MMNRKPWGEFVVTDNSPTKKMPPDWFMKIYRRDRELAKIVATPILRGWKKGCEKKGVEYSPDDVSAEFINGFFDGALEVWGKVKGRVERKFM